MFTVYGRLQGCCQRHWWSWAGLRGSFKIVGGDWFRFGGGFEVQGLLRLVVVLGQVLVARGFGYWIE